MVLKHDGQSNAFLASIGPGADGREWLLMSWEDLDIVRLQLGPALMAGNGPGKLTGVAAGICFNWARR